MNGREPQHSGGTWRIGKHCGAIVSDEPVEGAPMGADDVKAYGGYLIAESVAPCNRPILSAAPDMDEALEECIGVLTEPGMMGVDEWRAWQKRAVGKAQKALDKARGETGLSPLQWWGYRHNDGRLHLKRFHSPSDLVAALESEFVAAAFGPFEAIDHDEATTKLRELAGDAS